MKYSALIFREIKGRYTLLKQIGFKPDAKVISYKEGKTRSFIVKMDAISHETKKEAFLCFDYDTGDILSFNKGVSHLSPEDTDELVYHNIISSLFARVFSSIAGTDKGKLLTYIIIFLVGCLLGYMTHAGMNPPSASPSASLTLGLIWERVIDVSSKLLRVFSA